MDDKDIKYACMQGGPAVEKCPIAIQFLGTYVIVRGVNNHSGSIKMERMLGTFNQHLPMILSNNYWYQSK